MTAATETQPALRGVPRERRGENVISLPLPPQAPDDDRKRLVAWAVATVAEAEQRLARLQARVHYLEGLSITDELTGLLNRRGFMGELERALATARRGGPGGVVMLCDLDGFKAVNDQYGHNAGDDALRGFAQLVAGKIRRNDALGRLGGDEFAIVLVGATLGNARRKAQSLSQAIAATSFRSEGRRLVLGASFGLTPYGGQESVEELLHRADIAMYADKRSHGEAQSA